MQGNDENKKLLEEEMEKIKADILQLYNASGKRTTGEFEKGLKIDYDELSAVLFGPTYLSGRRAGKMPPIKAIEDWIKAKGIKPLEDKLSTSSLAFLIARKIAEKGTDKERHLKVYSQVITPERIQQILDRVSQLNANAFVQEVVSTITKSFNEFQ